MAISIKQRRWFLGAALALTLVAVAATEGEDNPDSVVVRPDTVKTRHTQQRRNSDSDLDGDVRLAEQNRQPLPEDVKDMFAGKSWYDASPPAKQKPEKLSAPPLPFVYMGQLAEQGEKAVILLAKQDRSYAVSEGDVLDNIYRVDEVKAPLMTVTYLPLNIKQTIRIGESN